MSKYRVIRISADLVERARKKTGASKDATALTVAATEAARLALHSEEAKELLREAMGEERKAQANRRTGSVGCPQKIERPAVVGCSMNEEIEAVILAVFGKRAKLSAAYRALVWVGCER
jgi:hypothetical protein